MGSAADGVSLFGGMWPSEMEALLQQTDRTVAPNDLIARMTSNGGDGGVSLFGGMWPSEMEALLQQRSPAVSPYPPLSPNGAPDAPLSAAHEAAVMGLGASRTRTPTKLRYEYYAWHDDA